MQDYNSSTSDEENYKKTSIDTSTPAGQRLSDAFGVIKSNCVQCHSSTMNLTTDSQWLESGYITAGSPTSSILYCRIRGSGCGAEDMPKDSALTNSDLLKLKTWIENL